MSLTSSLHPAADRGWYPSPPTSSPLRGIVPRPTCHGTATVWAGCVNHHGGPGLTTQPSPALFSPPCLSRLPAHPGIPSKETADTGLLVSMSASRASQLEASGNLGRKENAVLKFKVRPVKGPASETAPLRGRI